MATFIVDDNIYLLFSWRATNNKLKFSSYKDILNVMLTAIRKKHSLFTMDELGRFYQDHLKYAKGRVAQHNKM